MGLTRLSTLFVLLGAMLALAFAPGPARAADPQLCNAQQDTSQQAALEAVAASAWRCVPSKVDLGAKRTVMRLDVADGSEPRFAISRAAKFSAISIGVVSGDDVVWSHTDFDDVEATFFNRQFAVPLPDYSGQADAVLIAVEGATQATTFDHMRIEHQLPGSSSRDIALLLIVALFTGMMLMPILFDIVFYRILREQFILWHAALVASLGMQIICSFGLYTAFVTVHLPLVRVLTIGSFGLMSIAGLMFTLRFIERDKLPPRTSNALVWLMIGFVPIAVLHMAGIDALGRWPATVYFTYGAPVSIIFAALLYLAWRAGSRTVRYLLVGISPLLLVAITRVFSFMAPGIPAIDANELLLVATIIEVVATALGVASQFLTLKLDRDRAHAKVDTLVGEAQRDALTGLLNRRVIDNRYEELRMQGFDTFALIDLDHFKSINDRYGHQTGDAVLVACAEAIGSEGNRDMIALRLGGEEFVLLLRGKDATARAEALRQSITRRVAADVPHLDQLVTASMGVLELPRESLRLMRFEEIYARADKLLYEAKSSGRNRMMYERLKVFDPARPTPEIAA